MADVVRIAGRTEFHGAVRTALAEAAAVGWRELWFSDPDFADWPLNDAGVIEHLTQWAGAHRRLRLLALDYDAVLRRHPRFVRWRVQWSHLLQCRALLDIQAVDVPVVLHAPGALTVALLDPLRHQGRISRVPADIAQCGELLDAISQRSVEAFPATTIGL